MIPANLFQIWLGPMTEEVTTLTNAMRLMNSIMEYRLWQEDILDRFGKDPYVRRLQLEGEQRAHLVDRLRMLLLREDGGWYADVDCQAIRPFSAIPGVSLPHWDFVLGLRNPHRPNVALHRGIPLVDNTVMASAQNGRIINRLCDLYTPYDKQWLQTGASIGREILRSVDYTTMPLNYRYFYAETPSTETIVLHDHCNFGSWIKAHQMPKLVAV